MSIYLCALNNITKLHEPHQLNLKYNVQLPMFPLGKTFRNVRPPYFWCASRSPFVTCTCDKAPANRYVPVSHFSIRFYRAELWHIAECDYFQFSCTSIAIKINMHRICVRYTLPTWQVRIIGTRNMFAVRPTNE